MIDVVVDTSIWIDESRGVDSPARQVLHRLRAANVRIGMTDIVHAELRACNLDRTMARMLDRLADESGVIGPWELDDFDRAPDCMQASIRAGRRVRSITDCMVASVCIRDDVPLLHGDRDFDLLASCTDLRVLTT